MESAAPLAEAGEAGEGAEREKPEGADKPEKKLRSEVKFGPGTRASHCGICTHYRWASMELPPSEGTCQLVEGMIEPGKWCVLFKKQGAGGSGESGSK